MEFDIKTKQELATSKHKSGYNCAQAVACSFADELGIKEETLYKLAEGFGGGMATGQNGCGALMGACIVLGLSNSDGDINHPGTTKPSTMEKSSELTKRFKDKAGAIICKEIKDASKLSCPACVEAAVLCLDGLI